MEWNEGKGERRGRINKEIETGRKKWKDKEETDSEDV